MIYFSEEFPEINSSFRFFREMLPNKKDNIFQITLKTVFIFILIGAVVFTSFMCNYFIQAHRQQNLIEERYKLWETAKNDLQTAKDREDTEIFRFFSGENNDFKAWLTVGSGKISYPVYQTYNNKYYTNHNFKRKTSRYGALYFDANNTATAESKDLNIIINGNNMPDGTLFGELDRFRELEFFKRNTTVILYFKDKTATYKIFSVFLYDPEEDFGLLTEDLSRQDKFTTWLNQINTRSYIKTDIKSTLGDRFLTLVTDSNEFKGAKTVVVARRVRGDETTYVDTNNFSVNPKPILPKKLTKEDLKK